MIYLTLLATVKGARMDYPALAQELLSLRNDFDHLPIGAALADMSGGEFFALSLLLGRGRSLPSELGRAMHVSSARVAALLRHLEQKQWVRRQRSPGDERKHPVELTEAGRAAITRRRAEAIARIAALLEALGPEDAQEYIRLRRRLLAAGRLAASEEKEALS